MALSHLDALKIPSQEDHTAQALTRIENMIVPLHALLDLLNKPVTEQEADLVQRLLDLLTELKEELRLARKSSFNQKKAFKRIKAQLADQNRMMSEMHRVFMTATDTP